jgi:hypothetical protein
LRCSGIFRQTHRKSRLSEDRESACAPRSSSDLRLTS